MRNYIFTRAIWYQMEYFDEFHVSQGTFPVGLIGRNDVDLRSRIDRYNANFLSTLPPNWTIEPTYPNEAFTIYFLLDKESVLNDPFGFITVLSQYYVQDAIINQPPVSPILVNPPTTPRKTGWTDPAGVKRKPPPSETPDKADYSGAAALVKNFLTLCANLIAQIKATVKNKLVRDREVSIVTFARDNVTAGKWTITRALDYLVKAGLLN
jgi:hypothetical protein